MPGALVGRDENVTFQAPTTWHPTLGAMKIIQCLGTLFCLDLFHFSGVEGVRFQEWHPDTRNLKPQGVGTKLG